MDLLGDSSVQRVIDDVIARRLAGETLLDSQVLADHPALAAELQPLLLRLSRIDRARQHARTDATPRSLIDLDLPQVVPGYTLLREINRGGQAVVYYARRDRDGSPAAVKVLRDGLLSDARQRRRVEAEADILARLDHPQIVSLLDRGQTADGRLFLAMRFVDGPMLDPLELARTHRLHARMAIFVSACRAVQAAHAIGVVHRDLKPSNIRIDAAGRPHVLDFGLARSPRDEPLRHSLTVTGQFLGTFLWASPEQARGQTDVTPASDVYALGVILHQLLTAGRFPPQVYASMERVIDPQLASTSRPRRRLAALEDPRLEKVLWTALAADASARHRDAGALADAVEAALQQPSPRRSRRRELGMPLLIAASLAALLGWRSVGTGDADHQHHYHSSVEHPGQLVVNGRPILRSLVGPLHWVPPGEFMMGIEGSFHAPNPPRPARVDRGFYMGSYEVKQEAFEAVMGFNPSQNRGPALPVECVNYDEAVEFCRRLSQREGRRYRLPTEIEWEYACRAGTTTRWSFGDDPMLAIRYANLADLANTSSRLTTRMRYNDGWAATREVAIAIPNAWRLFDLHGNVWEWCAGPFRLDALDDASGVRDTAPIRGGSWWDDAYTASSGHRNYGKTAMRESTVGFRVACDE
jgi:serine/threonine protein kinase